MVNQKIEQITHSEEETRVFALTFAKELRPGDILLLEGGLGAGKTTFVQGIALGLGVPSTVMIHSPTFTLVNEYPAKIPLIHIDLYRIDYSQEFEELALADYLNGKNILAVEWAKKAPHYWPPEAIRVSLESMDSHSRKIVVTKS